MATALSWGVMGALTRYLTSPFIPMSVSSSASGSVLTFLSCVCALTEVVSSPPTSYGLFRGEGILQLFTLPDSPQQNGIAERRIGLVMEVARTSMIHAAAPHFLWPFAVRYAAHQLNLWPCVSFPDTSPTLRWTGKVRDALVFRVGGSRAFVRDLSAHKLSTCAIPCVDPLPGTAPVEVAVSSGAARGAASGGVEPGVAESKGAGFGGAEPGCVEPGGAESEGAVSGAGGAGVTAGAGGTVGIVATGPGGARTRGTGAAGTGGVGGAGARDPTEYGAAGAGGSGAGGVGAGGAGAGGTGTGAGGARV
ncbi:unnamed protein product [Closterium sp. NIES-54]